MRFAPSWKGDRDFPRKNSLLALACKYKSVCLAVGNSNADDYENTLDQMDPYDLNRFAQAQQHDYQQALSEIRAGRKRTHWMWYIFPQFDGLGFSATAKYYAIKSIAEAKAYLDHPVLGARLIECAEAVLEIEGRTAHDLFGSPDDMKLKSCATLFAFVSPTGSVFDELISKYYGGEHDAKTLQLLESAY